LNTGKAIVGQVNETLGKPLEGGDIIGRAGQHAYDKPVDTLLTLLPFLKLKGTTGARGAGVVDDVARTTSKSGLLDTALGKNISGRAATNIVTPTVKDVAKAEAIAKDALKITTKLTKRGMSKELGEFIPKAGKVIDDWVEAKDKTIGLQPMDEIFAYKSLHGSLEFKDVDGKKGIVTGYFARFDIKDAENDIIRKGAFQKSITEQGPKSATPRIRHLMNHDPFKPLGVITELKEDASGLYYESKIGTHTLGQEFLKMAESGLITEHSIGYYPTKSTGKKGVNRILTEIKLSEGSSLTINGVNQFTPLLSVKGEMDFELLNEKQKSIEAFCRKSDATDETIEMLLLHSKQLSQYIIDIKSTQPHNRTEPQPV